MLEKGTGTAPIGKTDSFWPGICTSCASAFAAWAVSKADGSGEAGVA